MKSNTSTEPPPGYDDMLNGIMGLVKGLCGRSWGAPSSTGVVPVRSA
jgi:hypothetical protein